MEMGTGKTKVALDLIRSKLHKVEYVLWICPCSLKIEIEAERQKWQPDLDIDIVGCESIGSSDRIYLEVLKKAEKNKTFIVVDESLKIKNREAKRTKRIMKLGEYAEYKLILNGTPVSKNVLDLWTQMQFLSPLILKMDYNSFKNTYTEYYIRGKLKGLVKKQHNIAHLISKIKPYIFDSELEIDSRKRYQEYSYEMDDTAGYESLKESLLDNAAFDFMAVSQTLQQYYCNSTKKESIIKELLREIDGRAIVFVKFLNSIPSGAKAICGETSEGKRKEIIEAFKRGEFKTLYITYGCGAFGLNLQCCKHMIFADHTFDYAQRIQAEARIYRMGQSEDVTYYSLWCECGLERLIKGSLEKKTNLLTEIKREIENKSEKDLIKAL